MLISHLHKAMNFDDNSKNQPLYNSSTFIINLASVRADVYQISQQRQALPVVVTIIDTP
jgi:hypothetical protein